MNKLFIVVSAIAFMFIVACNNNSKPLHNKRDSNSYYLDSNKIIQFLNSHPHEINQKDKLISFYEKRNFAYAWVSSNGINEHAGSFINMLNHEEIYNRNDSLFYLDNVHTLYNKVSDDDFKFTANNSVAQELEILLTSTFFDYAKRNWAGANSDEMEKVNWFIHQNKINYTTLLDSVLKNNSNAFGTNELVYRQYKLLKKYLQKYNDIEKKGGWKTLPIDTNNFKKGDTSVVISLVKKQLFLMNDLTIIDTTNVFDDALVLALQQFQNRHGLDEKGMLNLKTIAALNIPIKDRIQQILINMERSRWVPAQIKGDYLAVNIPEFKLHVYNNENLEWSCNVIVGQSKDINNTVIFNDDMKYIVFSPYWNITPRIIAKEILPAMKRNRNYLSTHNMEVVDGAGKHIATSSIGWHKYSNNFPYIIREKPGKNNSLGLVKFLFPNQYDIYLHDTPSKYLFEQNTRNFSHGCIRVQEPFKLAKFLLRNDTSYTDEKITTLMQSGKQKYVTLKTKVPVFIAYFTAWVDRKGKLNFREDIYHHDEKMKQIMFEKN